MLLKQNTQWLALNLSHLVLCDSVKSRQFNLNKLKEQLKWRSKQKSTRLNHKKEFLLRPPLCGEGGTLYSNGFFVQTILADRYIHRRELWVKALESTYILEYRNATIFSNFVFHRELSRFKVLWIFDSFSHLP